MATDLRDTALNPNMPMRRDQLAQMTATPRSPRLGFLADAMMALKEFANRVQVPAGVPLLGGEGVGSLLLGKAPEELVEMSYGNMPMRINPYAGQTASFVPEMKPGRRAQVADLLSLAPTPGGARAAAGLAGMADMGGAERALIGYHGTPHRFAAEEGAPLGRFRSEKIGTGEGAQAYGYGTYFAEAPGVAAGYRATLSSKLPDRLFEGGKKVNVDTLYGRALEHAAKLKNSGWNVDEAKRSALQQVDDSIRFNEKYSPDTANMYRSVRQQLEAADLSKVELQEGSLYTVDIPDEMIGKMLDWDKPLNKQDPEVQRALASAWAKEAGVSFDDAMEQLKSETQTAESWYRNESFVRGGSAPGTIIESGVPRNPAAVSEFLRQAGIPGIKYFDEQSRNIADDALFGLSKMRNKVAKAEADYKANPSEALADRLESARQELRSAERGASDLTRNIVVFPGEEQNVKILSRD